MCISTPHPTRITKSASQCNVNQMSGGSGCAWVSACVHADNVLTCTCALTCWVILWIYSRLCGIDCARIMEGLLNLKAFINQQQNRTGESLIHGESSCTEILNGPKAIRGIRYLIS